MADIRTKNILAPMVGIESATGGQIAASILSRKPGANFIPVPESDYMPLTYDNEPIGSGRRIKRRRIKRRGGTLLLANKYSRNSPALDRSRQMESLVPQDFSDQLEESDFDMTNSNFLSLKNLPRQYSMGSGKYMNRRGIIKKSGKRKNRRGGLLYAASKSGSKSVIGPVLSNLISHVLTPGRMRVSRNDGIQDEALYRRMDEKVRKEAKLDTEFDRNYIQMEEYPGDMEDEVNQKYEEGKELVRKVRERSRKTRSDEVEDYLLGTEDYEPYKDVGNISGAPIKSSGVSDDLIFESEEESDNDSSSTEPVDLDRKIRYASFDKTDWIYPKMKNQVESSDYLTLDDMNYIAALNNASQRANLVYETKDVEAKNTTIITPDDVVRLENIRNMPDSKIKTKSLKTLKDRLNKRKEKVLSNAGIERSPPGKKRTGSGMLAGVYKGKIPAPSAIKALVGLESSLPYNQENTDYDFEPEMYGKGLSGGKDMRRKVNNYVGSRKSKFNSDQEFNDEYSVKRVINLAANKLKDSPEKLLKYLKNLYLEVLEKNELNKQQILTVILLSITAVSGIYVATELYKRYKSKKGGALKKPKKNIPEEKSYWDTYVEKADKLYKGRLWGYKDWREAKSIQEAIVPILKTATNVLIPAAIIAFAINFLLTSAKEWLKVKKDALALYDVEPSDEGIWQDLKNVYNKQRETGSGLNGEKDDLEEEHIRHLMGAYKNFTRHPDFREAFGHDQKSAMKSPFVKSIMKFFEEFSQTIGKIEIALILTLILGGVSVIILDKIVKKLKADKIIGAAEEKSIIAKIKRARISAKKTSGHIERLDGGSLLGGDGMFSFNISEILKELGKSAKNNNALNYIGQIMSGAPDKATSTLKYLDDSYVAKSPVGQYLISALVLGPLFGSVGALGKYIEHKFGGPIFRDFPTIEKGKKLSESISEGVVKTLKESSLSPAAKEKLKRDRIRAQIRAEIKKEFMDIHGEAPDEALLEQVVSEIQGSAVRSPGIQKVFKAPRAKVIKRQRTKAADLDPYDRPNLMRRSGSRKGKQYKSKTRLGNGRRAKKGGRTNLKHLKMYEDEEDYDMGMFAEDGGSLAGGNRARRPHPRRRAPMRKRRGGSLTGGDMYHDTLRAMISGKGLTGGGSDDEYEFQESENLSEQGCGGTGVGGRGRRRAPRRKMTQWQKFSSAYMKSHRGEKNLLKKASVAYRRAGY